ncbi:MAG TPA: C39 family peptidase [Dehalococcoidia bacterium]|nr:C39 family peptidase [Dehalococcoidia bacterium]
MTRLLAGLGLGVAAILGPAAPTFAETPGDQVEASQGQGRPQLQPLQVAAQETDAILLQIPGRWQVDGTLFGGSNCGVASLSMILGAYGVERSVTDLRAQANVIQPPTSYDDGLHWDTLAQVARSHGLRTRGTFVEGEYRRWTPAELRAELVAGNPIIALVHYRSLPANYLSQAPADHYVVLTGFQGDNFFYHDPLPFTGTGVNMRISEADLVAAWDDAWPQRAAMVVYNDAPPIPTRQAPDQVARDPGRLVPVPAALIPAPAVLVPAPLAPSPAPLTVPAAQPRAAQDRPVETVPRRVDAIDRVGHLVGAAARTGETAPAPAWFWLVGALALAGLSGVWAARRAAGAPIAVCYTPHLQRSRTGTPQP